MSISVEKFGRQKFAEVSGKRMAYIDEGAGSAIVFQHGNPTSWSASPSRSAGLDAVEPVAYVGAAVPHI